MANLLKETRYKQMGKGVRTYDIEEFPRLSENFVNFGPQTG